MRMPGAGIRPLTVWETKRSNTTKCRCRRVPLYEGRWIETFVKSRYWRQATGRSDPKYLIKQNFCLQCASEFATDNNLPLLPAPRQDPEVGDRWREIDGLHRVVTVAWLDEEPNGLTVHFEPALRSGYVDVDKEVMWRFVQDFEPVEEP